MTSKSQSRHASESPTPEQLRERVEHTREELGRTVEELAAKADVKARAKEKAGDAKAKAQEAAGDAKAKVQDAVGHSRARLQDSTAHAAQRGPVPVLVVGAAAVLVWLQVRRRQQGGRTAQSVRRLKGAARSSTPGRRMR
ncbi:DUF3618 domain-containing protein [Streptomyces ochraceiscleroticus]|uniref:DUF3618 domain-containing protein n=1 Tax=Streptomyces ochraceiscleroticus TaxID=47761 RepID=A0ABW1MQZ3_9ACTN|nr:DUF3618 domain-containing protein [Streptomyces ochraceiscleroticus]